MESVEAVEKILNYSFTDKNLLKEAISFTASDCIESSPIFERLEFLGDSVLEVAMTNYIHLTYPDINIKELRKLRHANVSNEKFARAAVRNNLYQYIIREDPDSQAKQIKAFSEVVREEDGPVPHRGSVKAPKVLADIVESIAGAVYIDVNFDLQRFWEIFRGLLEPIYTLDDLLQKTPQESPFLLLFCLCQIHGKRIDFRYSMDDSGKHIAEVYLDDKLITSRCAISRDLAKLLAAKRALKKLSKSMPIEKIVDEDNLEVETEDKKGKLFEICSTEKLQLQTRSSSLPTVSENPVMATAEDSPYVEPEDVKEKSFEVCSTEKLQLQTRSSSLPTASENPLTDEMAQEQMVIDEDSPHVESEDVKGKSCELFSTRKLQIETGSSSLSTASPNPLTYELTTKQMVVDEDILEARPFIAKGKLIFICAKNKWPKPIFSVEEEKGPEKEQKYVCSVKIEIPSVEGTFHMKGDAKLRKKEAEYSAAYHMIRALNSSLMSLVISNLQMQKSLDEKKRKQNSLDEKKRKQNSLDEKKNLHSKKRKRKNLVENMNLQVQDKLDEKENLQTQESLDEKKNLQMQEILDENKNLHSKKRKWKNLDEKMNLHEISEEKKNLQMQESSDEKKNLQTQESSEENKNLQTQEISDEKKNMQMQESLEKKKNLQTQETSDENKNLQMQEGLDEKKNLQTQESSRENKTLQTQESLDEKQNLQMQESSDENKSLQTQAGLDEKKNLQMQESSDEKKTLQMQKILDENKNLHSKKRKKKSLDEKMQMQEKLDEKMNLQMQESSGEKMNLPTQEGSDEKKNLKMKEGLDEKKNMQMKECLNEKKNMQKQESADENKNMQMQEGLDEKNNLQMPEGLDEKSNLQTQESSDEKKNLQMQEGLDKEKNLQMQESSDEKNISQIQEISDENKILDENKNLQMLESSDEKNLHRKKRRRSR